VAAVPALYPLRIEAQWAGPAVSPATAGSFASAVSSSSSAAGQTPAASPRTSGFSADTVPSLMQQHPWEYGAFADGGFGTGNRAAYKFFNAGVHAGKVLTNPVGKGWLRGQFEYAGELMPLWQAYTPKFARVNCYATPSGFEQCTGSYTTGGTYSGVSITPIILRWNLAARGRWAPWIQGAGGLIWTNHKFPPVGPVPAPGHLGTSVFNFTPQFGIGVHYFVRPRQSIDFSANAVHVSSASLGDSNPGVNASVQLSIGYTWWK
jgi:lipid A 3-O-deacylase